MQLRGFLLILFAMTMSNGFSQMTPPTFNGWQFIPWGTDKAYCERLVEDAGVKVDPGHINAKLPSTEFVWEGWNTRLGYEGYQLYDVQQEIEFKKGEGDLAIEKFEEIKELMVETYGSPRDLETDETGMRLTIFFESKYNKFTLSLWNHPGWPPAISLQTNEKD